MRRAHRRPAAPCSTRTLHALPLTPAEADRIHRDNGIRSTASNRPYIPSGQPLREWTVELGDERDVVQLGSTSLSGTGEPLPRGDYYLLSDGAGFYRTQLVFSVVDTALVTKLSLDELLVWAVDYDSGAPLPGVRVEAEGPGLAGAIATTDASGLATFTVPHPRDVDNRDRSYLVRVDDSDHRGVTHTRGQAGAAEYQLGVPLAYSPREYVGHVYADRPIYRPGETVFYKGTVRRDDDARYSVPTGELPIEFMIRDSRYQELSRTPVALNEFGTFAGEFELPPKAAIGAYSVSIQVREQFGWSSIAGGGFRVAEFRVPEFQVAVETARANYVDGDSIEVSGTATFFFGGAVAASAASWSVLASPASLRVEGYERYSFGDRDFFRRARIDEPLRAEGELTTDAAGVASFAVPAALRGDEGTLAFQIGVTVTDQNQQAVASSVIVTVHPAAYYAGIRPASYIAKAGRPAELQIVTVDTEGELLPRRSAVVRIYEREWVTTKERNADGSRSYRSEPVDTLVATIPVETGAWAEAVVSYTPCKPGTLRLVAEATDEQGRTARASEFLWVSGGQYASWQVRNDDVIELFADRDSYAVGDVAEVLVPFPFDEGAVGLVTVERGKIISRSVRTFPTGSETLLILIEDGHVPNVFVGVVLYRPPTADDPLPRYKVGYVELTVSTASRVLHVEVQPDSGGKGGGSANPRLREEFRSTALWVAQLVTDAEGNASIEVPMPDNLTTWQAQVRAMSGDTMVGEATSEIVLPSRCWCAPHCRASCASTTPRAYACWSATPPTTRPRWRCNSRRRGSRSADCPRSGGTSSRANRACSNGRRRPAAGGGGATPA